MDSFSQRKGGGIIYLFRFPSVRSVQLEASRRTEPRKEEKKERERIYINMPPNNNTSEMSRTEQDRTE